MNDIRFIELAKMLLKYSFNDIDDYDELTILEKEIMSKDDFKLLIDYINDCR